ncbi:unnamed protein product [Gemmataceae bacterium]|nr:unnamed protein product [Gemmataceae bacterium]VTT98896.1 unnamed protein product [Gemmataceae bacterium]
MESWRLVWREGFAPVLATARLVAIAEGLRADDPRLIQGNTTWPPPRTVPDDTRCEAACLLGFCGWVADGLGTVGEVEEVFAELCFAADARLGEPAACRWLLNAWDDTPREVMGPQMIAEIEYELGKRGDGPAVPDPTLAWPHGVGEPRGLPAGREAEVVRA